MSKKVSKYQHEDGTFKEMKGPGEDHESAFGGCTLHMMNEEGHSADSAKRICGAIAAAGAAPVELALADSDVAAARMTGPLTIVPGGGHGVVVLQYMPPGQQTVSPMVNGEPMEMKVNVTPAWADVFERANQSLMAKAKAGLDNEPFTDFNHDDDRASSKPQRYFWGGDDPKTGGVLLETKLTASGKAAITKTADTEPDYSSFSPQWIFHKKTFEPLGLPINQGAFVNRAAFKKIGKLPVVSAKDGKRSWGLGAAHAADGDPGGSATGNSGCEDCGDLSAAAHKASSKAATASDEDSFNAHTAAFQAHKVAEAAQRYSGNDDAAEHHSQMMDFHKKQANKFAKKALAGSSEQAANRETKTTKGENMNEQEIATAMAKAFADPAFATAVNGVVTMAIKPLTEKIASLETERKTEATAKARDAVMLHVRRGAIAPEEKLPDGKTLVVDYYTEQMVANASATEMTLSRLPGKGPRRFNLAAGKDAMGAGNGFASVDPVNGIVASAHEARDKRPQDFKTDADALIAVCRSKGGWEQYQMFRQSIVDGTANAVTKQFTSQRKN